MLAEETLRDRMNLFDDEDRSWYYDRFENDLWKRSPDEDSEDSENCFGSPSSAINRIQTFYEYPPHAIERLTSNMGAKDSEVVREYFGNSKIGLRKLSGMHKMPIEEIAEILLRFHFKSRYLRATPVTRDEVLTALFFIQNSIEDLYPQLRQRFDDGLYDPDLEISLHEFLLVRTEMGLAYNFTGLAVKEFEDEYDDEY